MSLGASGASGASAKLKTVSVVAAIICDPATQRIYCAQRGYGDYKDGWEFPGGKVEPGESKPQALVREIQEELDCQVCQLEPLLTVEHDYPGFHLSMACFTCRLADGQEPTTLEHENSAWLSRDELWRVDWLAADRQVVSALEASWDRLFV